jgi:hypothetical protein
MKDLNNTISIVDFTVQIKFWIPITESKSYMNMENILIYEVGENALLSADSCTWES